MLGRSHILIADATWLALWVHADPSLAPPVLGSGDALGVTGTLALVSLGALLPDLDHPRAYLAQFRLMRGGLLSLIRPLAIPSSLLHSQFGHRGGMHSVLAVVAVIIGFNFVGLQIGVPELGLALGWGYAMHLVADMLTIRGIPLLWPVTDTKFGAPPMLCVTTGGAGESLLLALILAASFIYATAPQA